MAGMKRLAVGTVVKVRKTSIEGEADEGTAGKRGFVEVDDGADEEFWPYLVRFYDGGSLWFRKVELKVLKDMVDEDGTVNHADGSVTYQVPMTDAQFLFLAKAAHAEDMTFNTYVANVIRQFCEDLL